MAEHVCKRDEEIGIMKSDITHLQEYTNEDKTWKQRMEDKVDKILWFFLGQSVGLIITVLGGLIIYALTKQ